MKIYKEGGEFPVETRATTLNERRFYDNCDGERGYVVVVKTMQFRILPTYNIIILVCIISTYICIPIMRFMFNVKLCAARVKMSIIVGIISFSGIS